MQLDAGIARIMQGRNIAEPGFSPQTVHDQERWASYYGEKTVGVTRYWTAKAQNDQVDLLIEIQPCRAITTDDICRLKSDIDPAGSGIYKILQIQHLADEDGRPMTDLALERIGDLDGQT